MPEAVSVRLMCFSMCTVNAAALSVIGRGPGGGAGNFPLPFFFFFLAGAAGSCCSDRVISSVRLSSQSFSPLQLGGAERHLHRGGGQYAPVSFFKQHIMFSWTELPLPVDVINNLQINLLKIYSNASMVAIAVEDNKLQSMSTLKALLL